MEVGFFSGRETFVVYVPDKESLIHFAKGTKKFQLRSLEEATDLSSSALEAAYSHAMPVMLESAQEVFFPYYWLLVNNMPKYFGTTYIFYICCGRKKSHTNLQT